MQSTVLSTVNKITSTEIQYAPAVAAAVLTAQQTSASGASRREAVIDSIIAGSRSLEGSSQPTVAGIAGLVDLTVSMLNALGVFAHAGKPATATIASAGASAK